MINTANINTSDEIYSYVVQIMKEKSFNNLLDNFITEKNRLDYEMTNAIWRAILLNGNKHCQLPPVIEMAIMLDVVDYDGCFEKIKRFFSSQPDPIVSYLRPLLKTKLSRSPRYLGNLLNQMKLENPVKRVLKVLKELEMEIKALSPTDEGYTLIILRDLSLKLYEFCDKSNLDQVTECEKYCKILNDKTEEIRKNYEEEKEQNEEKLKILTQFYFEYERENFFSLIKELPMDLLEKLDMKFMHEYFEKEIERRTAIIVAEEYPWEAGKESNASKMISDYAKIGKVGGLEHLKNLVYNELKDCQKEEVDKLFKDALEPEPRLFKN